MKSKYFYVDIFLGCSSDKMKNKVYCTVKTNSKNYKRDGRQIFRLEENVQVE